MREEKDYRLVLIMGVLRERERERWNEVQIKRTKRWADLE